MARVTSDHIVYKIGPGGTASSDVGSSVGPSRDVWPMSSGDIEKIAGIPPGKSDASGGIGPRNRWPG